MKPTLAALWLCLWLMTPAAAVGGGRWIRDLTIRGKAGQLRGSGKVNIFLPSGYGKKRRPPYKLLVALHGWRGRGDGGP